LDGELNDAIDINPSEWIDKSLCDEKAIHLAGIVKVPIFTQYQSQIWRDDQMRTAETDALNTDPFERTTRHLNLLPDFVRFEPPQIAVGVTMRGDLMIFGDPMDDVSVFYYRFTTDEEGPADIELRK
jgi:hypothetical protein